MQLWTNTYLNGDRSRGKPNQLIQILSRGNVAYYNIYKSEFNYQEFNVLTVDILVIDDYDYYRLLVLEIDFKMYFLACLSMLIFFIIHILLNDVINLGIIY